MRRIVPLALGCFMAAVASMALAAHPYSPKFKLTSQVLDSAGIFKPRTLQDLKVYVEDSEFYTGNQLVIGVVPSFDGKPAEAYAMQAAQALNLNNEGKPGILLIVSQKDHDARIVAGPQLADVLPANVQQAILDRIVLPNLRQGKTEKGIIDGMGAIVMAVQGKYAPQRIQVQSSTGIGSWSPLTIIGVLAMIGMGAGRRRHYYCGSPMGGARRRW